MTHASDGLAMQVYRELKETGRVDNTALIDGRVKG